MALSLPVRFQFLSTADLDDFGEELVNHGPIQAPPFDLPMFPVFKACHVHPTSKDRAVVERDGAALGGGDLEDFACAKRSNAVDFCCQGEACFGGQNVDPHAVLFVDRSYSDLTHVFWSRHG